MRGQLPATTPVPCEGWRLQAVGQLQVPLSLETWSYTVVGWSPAVCTSRVQLEGASLIAKLSWLLLGIITGLLKAETCGETYGADQIRTKRAYRLSDPAIWHDAFKPSGKQPYPSEHGT